jgi:membrane-associated protease RseP (regulator of RpoE activity)
LPPQYPPFTGPLSSEPAAPSSGTPLDSFEPFPDAPPVRARFQHRYWVHALLLLVTLGTTTLAGAMHYDAFRSAFQITAPRFDLVTLLGGLWYSGTLLAILGAHELGHYFMCRRHNVDATLPYFLPAPLPLTGTVGAFIKIREMFPSKAVLFDIGVGGPIAGFVVLVPALFWGLGMSAVARLPDTFDGLALGEPLLFKLAAWLVWGPVPDGYSINLHPMAFAAWFGLIATALNLLPFGQLDGGHIAYAALGPRATVVSMATVLVTIGLTFGSSSWLVVTLMMVVMLFTVGLRHPRVLDEDMPLDATRRWIALASAVILVLCFTPAPIEPYQLIQNP